MAKRALPNLGLVGNFADGDDNWGADMDATLLKLSTLVQGGVKSSVAAVPGAPAQGDVHILTAAPNENAVAVYDGGAWTYYQPSEGWFMYDKGADQYVSFDGFDWVPFEAGGGGGSGIEDAPEDGTLYGRKDGAWEEITGGGGGGGTGWYAVCVIGADGLLDVSKSRNVASATGTEGNRYLRVVFTEDAPDTAYSAFSSAHFGPYNGDSNFPVMGEYRNGTKNAHQIDLNWAENVTTNGFIATPVTIFFFHASTFDAGIGGGGGGGGGGGAPVSTANRDMWRVRVSDTESKRYASLAEIEMHDVVNGPDLCVGAAPQGSTPFGPVPISSLGLSKAFDDNISGDNRWAPQEETPWTEKWVGYRFAAPVSLVEVKLTAPQNLAVEGPKSFAIEFYAAELACWVPAVIVVNAANWGDNEARTYAIPATVTLPSGGSAGGGGGGSELGGAHAYWQLYIYRNNGDGYTGTNELEFLDAAGNRIPNGIGGASFASGNGAGGHAAAFDGSKGPYDPAGESRWQTQETHNCYIGYHYATPVEVRGVRWYGAYFGGQTPRDVALQYSDDGARWTTLMLVSGQGDPGYNNPKTFMVP